MSWPDVVMTTIVLLTSVYVCLVVFRALTFKSPQLIALREMNTVLEEHLAIKSEKEAILLVARTATKVLNGTPKDMFCEGLEKVCASYEFTDLDLHLRSIFYLPGHDSSMDPVLGNLDE